jgi:hypothetical protein
LEDRWSEREANWLPDQGQYVVEDISLRPRKGQRPIVAFIGGLDDIAAIHLIRVNSTVVGKMLRCYFSS